MRTDHHQRKYLKDYQPAAFNIDKTDLVFYLDENRARVVSRLQLRRQAGKPGAALVLDGVDLELIELRIDGRRLAADEYRVEDETLTLETVPDAFELYCEVTINPAANTRLEGLYLSNGNYCTQCEAEGFRCITYYLDRPDVMSVFSTEIHAARGACPILLSNGNPVERGVEEDHHWVRWEDPFPKPSYLFALVAGDLACIEDRFVTRSGREVSLQIYTEQHNRDKCDHAMRSLQKAMRWDEDVFGLEYDLDLYMIVAVDDFNMGAMENKGLNVFNTRYVLASAQTATDDDYRMFRRGDQIRRTLQVLGIRLDRARIVELFGRTIRLVIILEGFLLDVHRAAQHDGPALGLGEIECFAHHGVGLLGILQPDEADLAGVGKARLIEILRVLRIAQRILTAERDDR